MISYLSVYGGVGLIGTGWGFLVNLIWSAVIYGIALRVRLPSRRVREQVVKTTAEASEEQQELERV